MGGGDLNLKKSWHPSTMKNMEKVWKAEQQDHQEKKRIAELKREIEMEKDKEDMTKYAMDQGVIEKKDDKKLDWMYKGPNQMVNREDYLLGKPIDKPFEQMAQAEKDVQMNRAPKNHVEYECIPPSLRSFCGDEQVDLARKLQEDPLYAIKKKEMETKSQLLKNPVRLKQLRDLLEEQSRKRKSEKKSKKHKKKKRSNSSSEEDNSDEDLDDLLARKYNKLKSKIDEDYLIKSMKKLKREKKKKRAKGKVSSSSGSSSDSDSEESEREDKSRRLKHRKNSNCEERETRRKECKKKHSNRSVSNDRAKSRKRKDAKKRRSSNTSSSDEEEEESPKKRRKKREQESHDRTEEKHKSHRQDRSEHRDKSPRRRVNGSSRDTRGSDDEERRSNPQKVDFGLMRADRTRVEAPSRSDSSRSAKVFSKDAKKDEKRWVPPKRQVLTEEEKERRRREMMANASWRDKERESNVRRYREQEKKEQMDKTYNKDFIRKQLAAAAEVGTVESRIRANINNIQRSGRAMDTNFAKR